MDGVVLAVTLGAEVLSAAAVGASIVFPLWRVWPPTHKSSRTGYLMWLLFGISAAGMVALGIIDWGSLELPPWTRWAIGVPMWSGGTVLASWAIVALGMASTSGGENGLTQGGAVPFLTKPTVPWFYDGTNRVGVRHELQVDTGGVAGGGDPAGARAFCGGAVAGGAIWRRI